MTNYERMRSPLETFDDAVKRMVGGGDTDKEDTKDPTRKEEDADEDERDGR